MPQMSLITVEDWKKSPYWNIILLALAWAFTLSTSTLLTTVGPLSAQYLGYSTSVASSTIGVFLFGAAMSSIPSGWLFRTLGRYLGFTMGCGFQILGCILGCIALAFRSVELLLLGCFSIGLAQGLGQFYRFYVVEVTPEDLKSRAVTYVLTGGIIAAFLGPYVATHSVKLLPIDYFGSYMMIALFAMLNQVVVSFTTFSPPVSSLPVPDEEQQIMLVINENESTYNNTSSYDTFSLPTAEAKITENEHEKQKQNVIVLGEESLEMRPTLEIITTPIFLFSCLVATLAHTMMVMIMSTISLEVMSVYSSSTSLALQYTAYIMQLHFLAMFAPGFFTGLLIEYFGSFLIALVGGIIFLLALFILTVQQQFLNYLIGMMLLGLGWNFSFSAGTVMLTTCYTAQEATHVQAVNDFILFTVAGIGSFCAGLLYSAYGWKCLMCVIFVLMIVYMTLFLLSLAHMQQVHHQEVKNEASKVQAEQEANSFTPTRDMRPSYRYHSPPRIIPFSSSDTTAMNNEAFLTPNSKPANELTNTTSEKHTMHGFYGSHSSLRIAPSASSPFPVQLHSVTSNQSIHDQSQTGKESNELWNEIVLVRTISV